MTVRDFWMDEDGLATVEYALLLALVAIAAVGAWTQLGHNVRDIAQTGADALDLN